MLFVSNGTSREEGLWRYDSSESQWKKIGAGANTDVLYIDDNMEGGVSSYIPYADSAAVIPADGTGGSPDITVTSNATTPLIGLKDLLMTKDAANRQGQGFSRAFTIDRGLQASVLTLQFPYKTSADYADNDVQIFIYDITNSRLIYTVPQNLKANTVGDVFSTEFQTSPDSLSYRVIFHIASTNASAYTINIDNVRLGPNSASKGPIATDWIAYTPTVTFSSGSMTNATHSGFWRRVGDSIEVEVKSIFSGAAGTWSTPKYALPAGLVFDDTKVTVGTTNQFLGHSNCYDTGNNLWQGGVQRESSTTVGIYYHLVSSTAGSTFAAVTQAAPFTFASGDFIVTQFKAPIAGWSSSAVMSNEADTRMVEATGAGNAGTVITAGTTNVDFAKTSDTHGCFDGTTFTLPSSGTFEVNGAMLFTTGAVRSAGLYVNGSFVKVLNNSTATDDKMSFYGRYKGVAGEALTIKARDNAGTLSNNTNFHHIHITKVLGPTQVMASEKVFASYATDDGDSYSNSDTVLDFEEKIADSHNAVTIGASWKFTAPKSSWYRVNVHVYTAGVAWTAGQFSALFLRKNGSNYRRIGIKFFEASNTLSANPKGTTPIYLAQGEYIDITINNSRGSTALSNSNVNNYIDIESI